MATSKKKSAVKSPEKEKVYKYKIWLEAERVEIDEEGKEIGDHKTGALFGLEPELLAAPLDFATASRFMQAYEHIAHVFHRANAFVNMESDYIT